MAKLTAKAKLLENVKPVCENNRGHSVICDLSEASGGTNAGPTPLELGLMALAGCGVIIFADVCKNSKIDPGKVEISVEAQKSGDSPVIKDVSMKVNVSIKDQEGAIGGCLEKNRSKLSCSVHFQEKIYLSKLSLKQNKKNLNFFLFTLFFVFYTRRVGFQNSYYFLGDKFNWRKEYE